MNNLGKLHITGKVYDLNQETFNRVIKELEFYMDRCEQMKFEANQLADMLEVVAERSDLNRRTLVSGAKIHLERWRKYED